VPEYYLTFDWLKMRLRQPRDRVALIPLSDLPYTVSEDAAVEGRQYLLRDVEAYERGVRDGAYTNRARQATQGQVAPGRHLGVMALKGRWLVPSTTVYRIPFAQLPYRAGLPGSLEQKWRSYLVDDVEAYEARYGKPSTQPRAQFDGDRERAIRAMRARTPTPTYDEIAAAFGISRSRVYQVVRRSGGDPAKAPQKAKQEAIRLQREFRKLVPASLEAHALRCNELIGALRACAAREGFVPPAMPHERFLRMVGHDVSTLSQPFGSLRKALEAAGLPIRQPGDRWFTRRAALVAEARRQVRRPPPRSAGHRAQRTRGA
jgi:hypothetical protein